MIDSHSFNYLNYLLSY